MMKKGDDCHGIPSENGDASKVHRTTSGGAVWAHVGLSLSHTTQATIALSSAESEFYATGGATARGLQHSWARHVPTDRRRQSTPLV